MLNAKNIAVMKRTPETTLAFSLQPLAFSSGGADQLRNAVNQLQSLLYAA